MDYLFVGVKRGELTGDFAPNMPPSAIAQSLRLMADLMEKLPEDADYFCYDEGRVFEG